MAHDEIIDSWKQPTADANAPTNPAGDTLSEDDIEEVSGGAMATEGAYTLGCCTVNTYDAL